MHFRTSGDCYATGYSEDAILLGYNSVGCSNYIPLVTWFSVKVEVFAGSNFVSIYINNVQLTSTHTMHYPHRASGGIVIPNGYQNIVQYKNLI